MGKKEKVEAMIEGGKASAAPPLGPALGPMGVNIGQVIAEINKVTADFKGVKVPVKVIIDTSDKSFTVEVGTPPTSGLIKKELGIELGSGVPNKNKVGNMAIEQVIKIAKMKRSSLHAKAFKSAVKQVIGSCNALGILVESKEAKQASKDVDTGIYDELIKKEISETSPEKLSELKSYLTSIQAAYQKEIDRLKALEAEKAAAEEAAKAAAGPTPAAAAAPTAAAPVAGAAKAPTAEKKPAEKKKK